MSIRQYRSIKAELIEQMSSNREIQIAEIGGYIILLRIIGERSELIRIIGNEMKNISTKEAKFIFEKSKKTGIFGEGDVFDPYDVMMDYISDH